MTGDRVLTTVERSKLSDQVFRQLRDGILSEKIRKGERLPPERELCDVLKVNRSSVREALKRLEQVRLIETRHGEGSIVLDFRLNAGFDLIGDLIMPAGEINAVAIRSIFEFRSLIGPEIARLAALRIEETELADIERIVERIEECPEDDVVTFQGLDFEFHYAMARAGGNLALVLILNSAKDVYFAYRDFFAVLFEEVADLRGSYRAIYDALRAHDEARSESLCRVLIERGNGAFWERFPEMDLARTARGSGK